MPELLPIYCAEEPLCINSDGCQRGFATASPMLRAIHPPPTPPRQEKNVEGAASPHETDVPNSDAEGSLSRSNVSYCRDDLPKLTSKAYALEFSRRTLNVLYHILGIADAAKNHF